MKVNLDTLKTEIEAYLQENGFFTFHGFSRNGEEEAFVEWDTSRYPDYKQFLHVAKRLDVRLIVLHHRDFSAEIIDEALEELEATGLEYEDRRTYEQKLRELGVYEGFTCALELSFDYDGRVYLFEIQADWYRELNQILDELTVNGEPGGGEDEDPLGGYYSKN
jgi:hypothetical protein